MRPSDIFIMATAFISVSAETCKPTSAICSPYSICASMGPSGQVCGTQGTASDCTWVANQGSDSGTVTCQCCH
ncbi:hypothetical protein FVEG_14882 [Fusarium verticillioides 7600]|uniref:Uncharacterized protein n=1 Tax=Gibberella moniliformis (strain M3125 / FGSC 7600) TaxID=334819 RepID=W7LIS0_GIBM7|nr:hypothetical protein FVEG_14882 [Fusarium verticillioides 7600]EWG38406.1 hypothetical protein FVEG_14882 [Fusarium verticillioides 7600]